MYICIYTHYCTYYKYLADDFKHIWFPYLGYIYIYRHYDFQTNFEALTPGPHADNEPPFFVDTMWHPKTHRSMTCE